MKQTLKNYKKNIALLLLGKIAFSLSIGWAIINIIYFKKIGINYYDIGMIFAFETILILLASIPLAYYSDNYNRKHTILFASLTTFLSTIFLIIFNNIYGAIIWAFLSGLSYAATAGPFESMLYENLKSLKRRHFFSDIYSNSHILIILTGAISAFLYPLLLEKNILFPMYISAFFGLISLIIFSMLFFKRKIKKNQEKNNHSIKILNNIYIVLRKIKEMKILLWIIIFEAVWLSGLWVYEEIIIQPFIESNYNMADYAIIFGLAMILQAIFVKGFTLLTNKINIKYIFIFVLVLSSIFIHSHIYFKDNLIMITILISLVLSFKNYALILISDIINKMIKSDFIRNTVFSVSSTISTIIYAIYIAIIGYSIDKFNVDNTLIFNNYFLVITGLILSISLLKIYKK